VPLGPNDVYVPHYYNTANWQPYYLTRDNLYQRVANLNVPNAVTVVSVDDFNRDFDWRRVRKADRNMLASANPVLDPLLLTPLRNAAVRSAWGRGKIDVPPGIARKLNDTTVVTSTTPAAPRFRPNLAKDLRVNAAPERAKGQKFQVRDERRGRGAPQTAQQPVAPQQQAQSAQPQRESADTRHEQRRMEQQQRQQQQQQQNAQRRAERAQSAPQAERAARPVRQQQPQGERVAAPGRQKQEQRRVVVPQQQRPQPQMRRESAPIRSQPAPRVERPQPQPQMRREQVPPARQQQAPQQQAPRAQPQPRPVEPRGRGQEKQQQKQQTQGPPSQGGGKGKGPKKP